MMAKRTYASIKAELEEAEDYIQELEDRLDEIVGVASGEEDEDDDEDEVVTE